MSTNRTDALSPATTTEAKKEAAFKFQFGVNDEIHIKGNNLNLAFVNLYQSVTGSVLDDSCNILKGFGDKDNIQGWHYKFIHALGYRPIYYIPAFSFAISEQNHVLNKIITAYLLRHHDLAKNENKGSREIYATRHFIMRTLRDLILQIHKTHKHNGVELIKNLKIVITLCNNIKNKQSWGTDSIFEDLWDKGKQKKFFTTIDAIISGLKSAIKKREAADESRQLAIALDRLDEMISNIVDINQDILIKAIFGENEIPTDLFADQHNVDEFSRIPTAEDKQKYTPEQLGEKLYEKFQGNGAIHKDAKKIINTPAKLQVIKTLFFMAAQEQKVAELEAAATKAEMQEIMAEVDREEERQLLRQADLSEEKATMVRSSIKPLASNHNNAISTQQADPANYNQLQDIRQKSLALIDTISQVMSDEIYSVSKSEEPSKSAAKSSAISFISCTQSLLKMHARLLQIKALARHLKEIVAGLGNFSKPTGLPQLQEFYSEARTSLYNMAALLEDYQSDSGRIILQLNLGNNWHKNLNDSTVKADSLVKLILEEALPTLENFNTSLRPGSMAKDLTKVVAAFQGVNMRLELLGRQFQISPVYNVIKQTTAAAILASKRQQEIEAAIGTNYTQFQKVLRPSKHKLLVAEKPTQLPITVLDDEDLEKLDVEALQKSKIHGHNITISDVLDSGQLEETVDTCKLVIPNHAPILLTEAAFKWIQAKQTGRKLHEPELPKADLPDIAKEGLNGSEANPNKAPSLDKSGLNTGQTGKSAGDPNIADLELIKTLNSKIEALKAHNDTLKATAPRFNRRKDFPLNVFSSTYFKFWMFLPFIPVHVLVLMPIAGICYLANSKSINADLAVYDHQSKQFLANAEEIKLAGKEIESINARIIARKQNKPHPAEKPSSGFKAQPTAALKEVNTNPYADTEGESGPSHEIEPSTQPTTPSSLGKTGFFAQDPIKLTEEQISIYAEALCNTLTSGFKEAVQKQYLEYKKSDEEALAKNQTPDYSKCTWKNKNRWEKFYNEMVEAAYNVACGSLNISEKGKKEILNRVFGDIVSSTHVASSGLKN